MNDGAKLDIDYKLKTRLVPAARATIMPVTLEGKRIIPKNAIKPIKKTTRPKGKGKPRKGRVPADKQGKK